MKCVLCTCLPVAVLFLFGCQDDDAVVGVGLSDICQEWGDPDFIESSENYGTRFSSGYPTVVLTYNEREIHVYLSIEGKVLGTEKIENGWKPNYKNKVNEGVLNAPDPFKN